MLDYGKMLGMVGLGIRESGGLLGRSIEWTPSPWKKPGSVTEILTELEQGKIDAALRMEELVVEFMEDGFFTYTREDLMRMDKWLEKMENGVIGHFVWLFYCLLAK